MIQSDKENREARCNDAAFDKTSGEGQSTRRTSALARDASLPDI